MDCDDLIHNIRCFIISEVGPCDIEDDTDLRSLFLFDNEFQMKLEQHLRDITNTAIDLNVVFPLSINRIISHFERFSVGSPGNVGDDGIINVVDLKAVWDKCRIFKKGGITNDDNLPVEWVKTKS